jgi:hypothetical protein
MKKIDKLFADMNDAERSEVVTGLMSELYDALPEDAIPMFLIVAPNPVSPVQLYLALANALKVLKRRLIEQN